MAQSNCGPAPFCARPACGSEACRPCKGRRPQDCNTPYRPGKTRRKNPRRDRK